MSNTKLDLVGEKETDIMQRKMLAYLNVFWAHQSFHDECFCV